MPSLDYYNPKLPHNLQRTVEEISLEERARLRSEFAPIMESYRRHFNWVVAILLLGALGAMAAACFGFVLVAIFLGILIALHAPRLSCPNCGKRIQKIRGPYCPECGKRALESGFFVAANCAACGKTISNSRRSYYMIHACTHCGLWLDDRGIRGL